MVLCDGHWRSWARIGTTSITLCAAEERLALTNYSPSLTTTTSLQNFSLFFWRVSGFGVYGPTQCRLKACFCAYNYISHVVLVSKKKALSSHAQYYRVYTHVVETLLYDQGFKKILGQQSLLQQIYRYFTDSAHNYGNDTYFQLIVLQPRPPCTQCTKATSE